VTRLEVLRPFVEQTVKEFLGVEELKVLDDGTIPIRAGSSAVNVRLLEGWPVATRSCRFRSPMLRGVKPSPELLEKLNDMNASFSFARAFVDGRDRLHRDGAVRRGADDRADLLRVRVDHVRSRPLG
jgi:hypothetical protein